MNVYVAGPMTGIPYFNFEAFYEAARRVGCAGHCAINPAEMCNAAGFNEEGYETGDPTQARIDGFDIRAAARRDLLALTECDAIYLLPGWQDSAGARAEKAVADWLGLSEFQLEERA
jgi:hypothetical protein